MKRSLRSWLWRVPVDREIDEELALHVEMRTRELHRRAGSIRPRPARRRSSGSATSPRSRQTMAGLARKRDREMNLALWLDEFRADLKFAVRQLLHAPAFTLVATLTLALGIGANSAIFALVDATLLRPLPYRRARSSRRRLGDEPEDDAQLRLAAQYVRLEHAQPHLREDRRLHADVGGMVMAGVDGNAETVSRQWVTAGIFDVLGVTPVVGRTFTAEDEAKRANVVVLSEPFWRARYDGDPGVLGREVRLDGSNWTIVGVVPKEFEAPRQAPASGRCARS